MWTIVLFIFSLTTLSSTSEKSWTEILHADLTCCSLHSTETSCAAELGSNCEWVTLASEAYKQTGHQCVGSAFKRCIEADPTACCGGCCDCPPKSKFEVPPGIINPPENPKGNPVCSTVPLTPQPTPAPNTQHPTTPQPTAAPTPLCTYQTDYDVIGSSCVISGDPHTTTFNGQRHDFQGQPDIPDPQDGIIKDQYYYIHHCDGYDTSDMPFNVLGTHHKWGTRTVSGMDYVTVELFDNNNEVYYVYISSGLHHYGKRGAGAVSHYDTSTGLTALISGNTIRMNSNSKFGLYYQQSSETSGVYVTLTIDDPNSVDPCVFKIYMKRQTNKVDGRYRMHYVSMTQSTCYKCATCGLCAGFDNPLNVNGEKHLETCSGGHVVYRAGWNGDHTPEAYDFTAWTWEKNFVDNDCSKNYDITDNDDNMVYVDPCAPENKDKVARACQAARDALSECCNKLPDGFCDNLQEDCDFDACAAVGAGATDTAIAHEVQQIFGDAVELACRNPDMINDFICTSRQGTSIPANSIGESKAHCVGNEVMVSCGIDGWHNIGGTKVENNVCIASTDGPAQHNTYAMAYCCAFPTLANAKVNTVHSAGDDVIVTTNCNAHNGAQLTGCQAFHQNGPINQLRGTFTGVQHAPPQQDTWMTSNTCTSGGRAAGDMNSNIDSTVVGGAQCVSVSDGYTFECKTRAKWAIKDDSPTCEDGFQKVSCNAWVTSDKTLDDYHMNAHGVCYTQDDSYAKLYANVVCCKLTPIVTGRKNNDLEFVASDNNIKINDSKYGLFLQNGYIQLLGGMVFVIVLYGIVKYILCKRNDAKYLPISDPINSRKNINYV